MIFSKTNPPSGSGCGSTALEVTHDESLDAGRLHAGDDVGDAVGVDGDRCLGEGHAEGRDHRVGAVDRRGDGGRVVDVAADDVEARMLDREGVGMAGEGDDVVVLVERQPGEESTGGAIGPEHCELHGISLSMCARASSGAGYIDKDAALGRSVTSPAACGRRLS